MPKEEWGEDLRGVCRDPLSGYLSSSLISANLSVLLAKLSFLHAAPTILYMRDGENTIKFPHGLATGIFFDLFLLTHFLIDLGGIQFFHYFIPLFSHALCYGNSLLNILVNLFAKIC